MATWNITVPAGSGVGGTGSGNSAITEPVDFDGATINSVTVSGTPTVTSDGTTDDTIGIRWNITTSTGTAIYGGTGSDAASLCSASLGNNVASSNITAGGSTSPAPTTAVAADWDEIRYAANYLATMKNDNETVSWSSFTIVVDYTAAAPSDDLLADDVETTSEVTTPTLGQEHALTATSVEATSEVTTPTLGQEHALLADDVEATSEVTTPTIALTTPITADDVEATSELTVPTLGQEHALLADDVESTSEVGTPTLGQEHALLADDVEATSEVTTPTLASGGGTDNLTADDVETTSEVTTPTIGQTHGLLSDDVEAASEVTEPTLASGHSLSADDVEATSEVSIPTIGQIHVLAADDTEAVSETSQPSITEAPAGGGGGGPVSYDQYWDNVTLLVQSDDADASTTFVDSSNLNNTPTVTGTTQHDTAQSKWGGSSIYFPGAGDEISFPKDAVTGIFEGSGDDHTDPLTIECWIRCASLGATQYVFGTRFDTGSVNGMALRIGTDGATQFYGYKSSPTATVAIESAASTIAVNTWHFLQITYDGTTWEYLVDGVSIGTSTGLIRSHPTNNEFILGTVPLVTVDFDGWIDDFRYTRGIVRDNAVPTTAFPAYGADAYYDKVFLVDDQLAADLATSHTDTKGAGYTLNNGANFTDNAGVIEIDVAGSTESVDISEPAAGNFQCAAGEPWTLETRFRKDSGTGAYTIFENRNGSGAGADLSLYISSGTNLVLYADGVDTRISTGAVISNGVDYHVALTYHKSTVTLWLDGVSQGTWAAGTSLDMGKDTIRLGNNHVNSGGLDGQFWDYRWTKGASRYNAAFTPPARPLPLDYTRDADWAGVTVLLGADRANASTTFTDESIAGTTLTANGNVQYSTADPKFGASAIEFDGTGDYISTTITDLLGSSTLDMDLTIEMWLNVDSLAAAKGIFGSRAQSVQNSGIQSFINTDGSIGFTGFNNTASSVVSLLTAASLITVNTWHHVRVTRASGTWTIEVDNIVEDSDTETGNVTHVNGTAFHFGANRTDGSPLYFDGQMEQIRVTNGVARSTTVVEPFPDQPVSTADPYWNDVKLLALFQTDANDSTTLANDFTLNGNAAIVSQKLELDGTGDYATQADDADLNLWRDQDYCLEMFLELDTFDATADHVIGNYDAATDNWSIDVFPTGAIQFFYWSGAVNTYTSATGVISTGTRHHIVFQHRADTNAVELFVDGVSVATGTASNTPSPTASTPFEVGGRYLSRWTDGRIDNLRVTHAIRYNSSYDVPATPFPTQGDAPPAGPTIDTQPQSQSVDENQTATFTVAATGTGTLTYQWTLGGVDISGATSSSYTTPTLVYPGDDGNVYAVKVTDDNGTTTSNNATLTVNELLPVIDTQPQSATVDEQTTTTLTVAATASTGGGALSYQWKLDGVDIPGATSSSYTTPTLVYPDDDGNSYTVVVTDANGSVTSSAAVITVTDLTLTITVQPSDIESAAIGSIVTFESVAEGANPVSVLWLKDDVVIEGQTSTILSYTVQEGDAGALFKARFTAADGEVVFSNTATIQYETPFQSDIYYTVDKSDYRDPIHKRGYIELSRPLTSGESIQILRNTGPLSNDLDPETFKPFDTEGFEYTLDKYILRLQEIEAHGCDCRDDYTVVTPPDPDCIPDAREECQPFDCSAVYNYLRSNPATLLWEMTADPDITESLVGYGTTPDLVGVLYNDANVNLINSPLWGDDCSYLAYTQSVQSNGSFKMTVGELGLGSSNTAYDMFANPSISLNIIDSGEGGNESTNLAMHQYLQRKSSAGTVVALQTGTTNYDCVAVSGTQCYYRVGHSGGGATAWANGTTKTIADGPFAVSIETEAFWPGSSNTRDESLPQGGNGVGNPSAWGWNCYLVVDGVREAGVAVSWVVSAPAGHTFDLHHPFNDQSNMGTFGIPTSTTLIGAFGFDAWKAVALSVVEGNSDDFQFAWQRSKSSYVTPEYCVECGTGLPTPEGTCTFDNDVLNATGAQPSLQDHMGGDFVATDGTGTVLYAPFGMGDNSNSSGDYRVLKSDDYGLTWSDLGLEAIIGNIGGFYQYADEVSCIYYGGGRWWILVWNNPEKISRKYHSTDLVNWTAFTGSTTEAFSYHTGMITEGSRTYYMGKGLSSTDYFGYTDAPGIGMDAKGSSVGSQFYTRAGVKLGTDFYWVRGQGIPQSISHTDTNNTNLVEEDIDITAWFTTLGADGRLNGFSPPIDRGGLETSYYPRSHNVDTTLTFWRFTEGMTLDRGDGAANELPYDTVDFTGIVERAMFCGMEKAGQLLWVACSDWPDNTQEVFLKWSEDGGATWSEDYLTLDLTCALSNGLGTDKGAIGIPGSANEQLNRSLKYLGDDKWIFAYKEAITGYPATVTFSITGGAVIGGINAGNGTTTPRPNTECNPYAETAVASWLTDTSNTGNIATLNDASAITGTVATDSYTYTIEGTFGTPTQPSALVDGPATDYAQVKTATSAAIDLTGNVLKIDFTNGGENQNPHTLVVVNDIGTAWERVGKFDWSVSVNSTWINVTDWFLVDGEYTWEGIWEVRRVGSTVESRLTRTITAASGAVVSGNPAPSTFVGFSEVEEDSLPVETDALVLSVQGHRQRSLLAGPANQGGTLENYGGMLHINGHFVGSYGYLRGSAGSGSLANYNTVVDGERFFTGTDEYRFNYLGSLDKSDLVGFILAVEQADSSYTVPDWCP